MLIRLLIKLLKNKRTSQESKGLILNYLLESVSALPTKDIITFSLNTVKVSNKELGPEQSVALREGAVSLGKNFAYRLLKEQIAFEAIEIGIHKGQNYDQLIFSKAALWIQQREKELISKLAADSELFDTENV